MTGTGPASGCEVTRCNALPEDGIRVAVDGDGGRSRAGDDPGPDLVVVGGVVVLGELGHPAPIGDPAPDTDVTVGGVELLVLTVRTMRSPTAWGETDSVTPVPVARLPTAEMAGGPLLLPPPLVATAWPQAL
jgi:hypothetical protein